MNNPYDHAPVRVRRQATRWAHVDAVVSIHAPVRVRPEKTALKEYLSHVSIHAPVRMRLLKVCFNFRYSGFNPRTREGATSFPFLPMVQPSFQSTHP